MRALVIYESMYGNTHLIADAVSRGLADGGAEVSVVPVGEATPDRLTEVDLVVVGGPTHAHGMSRRGTREAAVAAAQESESGLHLDPDAEGDDLRDWFDALPAGAGVSAAAFDTRIHISPVLSGRASKGISKRLRHHGWHEVAEPESFFVDKESALVDGEDERAVEWGRTLARVAVEVVDHRSEAGSPGQASAT